MIGKMEEMFGASFQDISELNQATQFLHENGNKNSENIQNFLRFFLLKKILIRPY